MTPRLTAAFVTVFMVARLALISIFIACAADAVGQESDAGESARWVLSYDAGYVDGKGAYAGGSEIMHLAAHNGKLFAANGYWMDGRWEISPEGQKQ